MSCKALELIADRQRLRLKRMTIKIAYNMKADAPGASWTGIIRPQLSLTIPGEGVDAEELAEMICCFTRASIIEAILGALVGLLFVIGYVTGIEEAIILGIAGMILSMIQTLVNLFTSRGRCSPTRESTIVAKIIISLARQVLEAAKTCSDSCSKLIAYNGQVYRITVPHKDGDRIEILLKPL